MPWWLTGWEVARPLPLWDVLRVIGAVLLVAGVTVLIHAFARFAGEGRDTPAPVAPTERLVVGGLYRYIRNPMYVAVVAVIGARRWCSAGPARLRASVAVASNAAFVAVAGLLTSRGLVALLPAALVVTEWARTGWPLGGFPLAGVALGQADAPYVTVATLTGPLGLLAVTALSATILIELRRRAVRPAGVAGLVVVAIAAGGAWATGTTHAASDPQQVAVVQGGGPRGIPAVVNDDRRLFDRHLELSAEILPGTGLIVWPEGVVQRSGGRGRSAHEHAVAALAGQAGATLVAGAIEQAGDDRFRNAALAWSPAGELTGRYDKVHRVPFGEYVPARVLLHRLVDLSLVPRDAIPGDGPGLLATPAGHIGVAISFEVFFPHRVRDAVRAGGQLLVVPTNAASFTTVEVPTQQLAAARLRAIETGRPLLQAGPTGYSAIIGHDGTVAARTELGATQLLTGETALRDGTTPYTRLGDLPLVGLALVILAAGAVTSAADDRDVRNRWRRRPRALGTPQPPARPLKALYGRCRGASRVGHMAVIWPSTQATLVPAKMSEVSLAQKFDVAGAHRRQQVGHGHAVERSDQAILGDGAGGQGPLRSAGDELRAATPRDTATPPPGRSPRSAPGGCGPWTRCGCWRR